MTTDPLHMPCLKLSGLQILPITANERYLLGENIFLATHTPMQARLFPRGYQAETSITEAQILEWVLNRYPEQQGNRVFILYGAAGSGKSELMAWLELMIRQRLPNEAFALTRISRTDLTVFQVMERFKHLLTDEYFTAATHRRWEEMRRKPRTFTKLLVLHSLETLVESDALINALYYRLVDVVEPHVARLSAMKAEDLCQPELLPYEDFEYLRETTVLPISLDIEQFRHLMMENLRKYLFEEMRLPDTLQQISEAFCHRGIRPILLVDDLVQSINIFADEMLDYFITLEKGNWDVVIGLTPASFETDARGRKLLDRITYLDTIDDRVNKIWLSDEQGQESYFLTEENCHLFAHKYLNAMRQHNGIVCQSCPSFQRCTRLSTYNQTILAPFSHEVLVRILRSAPEGKGRVRYFLQAIKHVIELIIQGLPPEVAISTIAKPDIYIEAQDPRTQQLLSWYGPLTTEITTSQPNPAIFEFFDLPRLSFAPEIHSLTTQHNSQEFELQYSFEQPSPSRLAIRDWLLGGVPNPQLFDKFRRGIGRWLKNIYPSEYFYRLNIAKPLRTLRFRQVELGTSPSIIFEDLNDDKEVRIPIGRNIGQAAFWLERFSLATGDESHQLARQLCSAPQMLNVLWHAELYRKQGIKQLEDQLRMPLEEFVYHLYVLRCMIYGVSGIVPPGFNAEYWNCLQQFHQTLRRHIGITEHLRFDLTTIEALFTDFFEMRHNVYDGAQLANLCHEYTPLDSLGKLTYIQVDIVDSDYCLRGKPFNVFWKSISGLNAKCLRILSMVQPERIDQLSLTAQETIMRWHEAEAIHISNQLTHILEEIELYAPDIYRRLAIVLTLE